MKASIIGDDYQVITTRMRIDNFIPNPTQSDIGYMYSRKSYQA